MSFADLGLIPELLQAVTDAGYTEPTPIQRQAIPIVIAGKDVMGGAQTRHRQDRRLHPAAAAPHRAPRQLTAPRPPATDARALILAPTRELAMQVFESVKTYSKHLPLRSMCVYGGVDIRPQQAELRRGIEVVIATPGRLLRPHRAEVDQPVPGRSAGARRSRPHARHGLHPRHQAHPRPAAQANARACCSRPPSPTRSRNSPTRC